MSKIFWILVLAALVVGVHAGFKYAMPEYRYKVFKSDMEEVMQFSVYNEKDLKKRIMKFVQEDNIPIKSEDDVLVYTLDKDQYMVRIAWEEYVDYFGYHPKTYSYSLSFNDPDEQ